MGNKNLGKAKKAKNDEFYTQISDIEKELVHYKDHFRDKVVFCNCDDPEESNFWKYFMLNFEHLGLKKLISTHYHEEESTYKLEYDGENIVRTELEQNGDFRSPEAVEILMESQIIVSNPPFSLFRDYVAQLIEYDKEFLIMGNNNAITYKEIFPLLKDNKMWLGYHSNKTMEFEIPDDYERWSRIDEKTGKKYGKVPAISWFTNLEHSKRHEKLILYKEYTPEEYPKYDNYDAINVNKIKDIPKNYFGVMGVPITIMGQHNIQQFEIVGCNRGVNQDPNGIYGRSSYVNGKETFKRVFIKAIN